MVSTLSLAASLVAVFLLLKQPPPVAHPQAPAAVAANAQSFDQKMAQLEQAAQQSPPSTTYVSASASEPSPESQGPKAEVRINSDEITAVIAQSLGTAAASPAGLTPDSNVGSGAPSIKDQQISFEGDLVHGQFLTEIAGKDVWITVSGHIGEKDGFATFDPTEFKVGDLSVPVSLVNPTLQKKLDEQRDRMKLPAFIGGLKVENGELVVQQK
jgi:hypothetical protein